MYPSITLRYVVKSKDFKNMARSLIKTFSPHTDEWRVKGPFEP